MGRRMGSVGRRMEWTSLAVKAMCCVTTRRPLTPRAFGPRRELADPAIARHHGSVVKTTGDGILIELSSVVDAVACAVAIQDGMVARDADVPEDKRIVFRIGINIGDVIIDEADILGDGVNVAARLEGLAQAGEICISEDAYRQVRGKLDEVALEDMGEQALKNIARPMRVASAALDHIRLHNGWSVLLTPGLLEPRAV
jgi:class 3 adenylate cyclase